MTDDENDPIPGHLWLRYPDGEIRSLKVRLTTTALLHDGTWELTLLVEEQQSRLLKADAPES